MNQIVQMLMISGIIVFVAGTVFYYAQNNISLDMESQYDKTEKIKNQSGEYLKLIDVYVQDGDTKADVMNLGVDEIIIKKIFVDGVEDNAYSPDTITQNEITTITPSINGDEITIITENEKIFRFEK